MNSINKLAEFLRIDRRFEEANKVNEKEKHIIKIIDTQEEELVPYTDLQSKYVYKRLADVLDNFDTQQILVEVLPNRNKYYIELPNTDDGFNYLNLETFKSEQVTNTDNLIAYPLTETTDCYFYDMDRRVVVTCTTILEEISVFSDRIVFDPQNLNIDSGNYEYKYEKKQGALCGIINTIIDFIGKLTTYGLFSNSEDKVETFISPKRGTIFLIPEISSTEDGYRLTYYYSKVDKKKFGVPDWIYIAIILNFNGIESFLAFLNETIIGQSHFDFSESQTNKRRTQFIEDYKLFVLKEIERKIYSNNSYDYDQAMKAMLYLTDDVVPFLSSDALWHLFEIAVKKNSLTNKLSNAHEDSFVKLLEIIASNERTKENFLFRFLQKIKGENITYIEYIYNRINGENAQTFVNIIHKVWMQTRYVFPSISQNKEYKETIGPLFLPYSSVNHFGFYFSNASLNIKNKQIQVALNTGKKEMKEVYRKEDGGLVKDYEMQDVIEHYVYHLFHPIYIKDVEKQETAFKLDAIIPAFMLYANQDQQFWHNVLKTGEYALDIISILSGFGALAEIRYFARVAQLVEGAEGMSKAGKILKAVNFFKYIKGAAGIAELTSGTVNLMLKITRFEETEVGQKLAQALFYLELITMAGELTFSLKGGLKKAAKEAVDESTGVLRNKYPKVYRELYKIAEGENFYHHVDNFMNTRPKFHSLNLVNQLWLEKITSKLLHPNKLRKLYLKYLEEFPGLKKGFNQAEFKTTILNKGQKVEEVIEFSLSGDRSKLTKYFGNPPDLPENTIDILSDYDNFEAFVKGAKDFGDVPRNYDSEIKYIFNFLKNHIDKGDEFIIETQNIFKACGSCRREFVMLEDYLKLQGKKVKFVVFSDETIDGTRALKDKLKIK